MFYFVVKADVDANDFRIICLCRLICFFDKFELFRQIRAGGEFADFIKIFRLHRADRHDSRFRRIVRRDCRRRVCRCKHFFERQFFGKSETDLIAFNRANPDALHDAAPRGFNGVFFKRKTRRNAVFKKHIGKLRAFCQSRRQNSFDLFLRHVEICVEQRCFH
jgi:hypothetical protein